MWLDRLCQVVIYKLKTKVVNDVGCEFQYLISIKATNVKQQMESPARGNLYENDKAVKGKELVRYSVK